MIITRSGIKSAKNSYFGGFNVEDVYARYNCPKSISNKDTYIIDAYSGVAYINSICIINIYDTGNYIWGINIDSIYSLAHKSSKFFI